MMRIRPIGIGVFIVGFLVALIFSPGRALAQGQTLAETYKTGKVKFVPIITITDQALGGKDFFNSLADIDVDDKGNIYACDSRANNIKKFDATGRYLKTIGKQGQGPGDFSAPVEVEISGGRLFVRELDNQRVSVIDPEGNFLKSVAIMDVGTIWWKMKALRDGRFIVEKEKRNYADHNAPQECFLDLYSPDFEFVKTVYKREFRGYKYISRINAPIPFSPRVHWDATADGTIAIGYSEKYAVEIHDVDKGKLSTFSHPYKPVEVTAQDKDRYFKMSGIVVGSSSGRATYTRGVPYEIVKNTEFPKYKPPFADVKTDWDGNIWIDPYFAEPKAAPGFDAFDRNGAFLGAVEISAGGMFPGSMSWEKDGFWTIHVNKDGEYSVVKVRIEAAK
jgi:hypothetical protein